MGFCINVTKKCDQLGFSDKGRLGGRAHTHRGSHRSQVKDEQMGKARRAREGDRGVCWWEIKQMLADGRRTWTSDCYAGTRVRSELNR